MGEDFSMEANLRLKGKTAVITGAASGIGKEIALLFASHGARVALIDRDIEKLNEVIEEQTSLEPYCVDITDECSVMELFQKIAGKFGRIDILVNCAGIFAPGKVTEVNYSQWKNIMSVNLDGAFLCSKYAAESMLNNGKPAGGDIINIASEAGLVAIAGQTAYNVSKAAMIHLSKSMAVDYALEGIRVNCVCPGRVLTPLVQNIIDNSDNPKEILKALSSDRPLMRMGTPKDIAHACLHFADGSMTYATGAVLAVDGAYTAR